MHFRARAVAEAVRSCCSILIRTFESKSYLSRGNKVLTYWRYSSGVNVFVFNYEFKIRWKHKLYRQHGSLEEQACTRTPAQSVWNSLLEELYQWFWETGGTFWDCNSQPKHKGPIHFNLQQIESNNADAHSLRRESALTHPYCHPTHQQTIRCTDQNLWAEYGLSRVVQLSLTPFRESIEKRILSYFVYSINRFYPDTCSDESSCVAKWWQRLLLQYGRVC